MSKAKQKIIDQINKCGVLAAEVMQQLNKLDKMVVDVYGASYSEVDCDEIIDAADFGGCFIGGVSELDYAMYESSDVPRCKKEAMIKFHTD